MESDWRSQVSSDTRQQLVADLCEELRRLTGHPDEKVRSSGSKFELMLWTNSADRATYLTKMQRKLNVLKAKPSSDTGQSSAQSQYAVRALQYPSDPQLELRFVDVNAAGEDAGGLEEMKNEDVEAWKSALVSLDREASREWTPLHMQMEIKKLVATLRLIMTMLEGSSPTRVTPASVQRFVQRHLLPIQRRVEDREARLQSDMQQMIDELHSKRAGFTQQADEVHDERRREQEARFQEQREQLLEVLSQQRVSETERAVQTQRLQQQQQMEIFRLQQLRTLQQHQFEQQQKQYLQKWLEDLETRADQQLFVELLRAALVAAGGKPLSQQHQAQQQQRQQAQRPSQAAQAAQAAAPGIPSATASEDVPMLADKGSVAHQPDGFLAAPVTYGVWSEPTLLAYRIDPVELTTTQQLTSGHFGELWIGTLRSQRVAIKRLAVPNQTKTNALAFAAEIKLMTQIQHPNIVAFVGVEWTKEWQAQAVTEFISDGDVRSLLDVRHQEQKSEELTWAAFKCQVAIDVVDALVYLHGHSVGEAVRMQVLKARHVLLDPETRHAKLSLYAVARSRPVLSATNSDESSLRWLAPELATGEAAWTDRSTIFSFGVMLSELDTTRLPYYDAVNPDSSAISSFKVLQLVTKGKMPLSLSDDCPEAVAAVVRQCTARDPQRRPSAAQLAFTLRSILKNEL